MSKNKKNKKFNKNMNPTEKNQPQDEEVLKNQEAAEAAIDEETRRKMNEYAVLAAKTVGYTNAGTIEFIVDPKGNFYFMEMNTRSNRRTER